MSNGWTPLRRTDESPTSNGQTSYIIGTKPLCLRDRTVVSQGLNRYVPGTEPLHPTRTSNGQALTESGGPSEKTPLSYKPLLALVLIVLTIDDIHLSKKKEV